MSIEQVKPEVDYYVRVMVGGSTWYSGMPWNKSELDNVSNGDLKKHGIKTKWRPVYKKD